MAIFIGVRRRQRSSFLGQDKSKFPNGSRLRRTVDGWRNTDLKGKPLRISDVSGAIIKTAGFRSTICRISAIEPLFRLINGNERDAIANARATRAEAVASLVPLIRDLTPKDFELLVELVFAQSGWRRVGATGGTQKDADIELEMPITGERAFVEVKTSTHQKEFERYASVRTRRGDDRLFYVYHSAPQPLVCGQRNVTIIDAFNLAAKVHDAGLFEFVMRRSH